MFVKSDEPSDREPSEEILDRIAKIGFTAWAEEQKQLIEEFFKKDEKNKNF